MAAQGNPTVSESGPVDDPRQHVATEVVGPQPELRARSHLHRVVVLEVRSRPAAAQGARMARRVMSATQLEAIQKPRPRRFLTAWPDTWSGSRECRISSSPTWPSAISPWAYGSRSAMVLAPEWKSLLGEVVGEAGSLGQASPPRSGLGEGAGMADPWVDDGIQEVDAEVDEHVANGDQDHPSLYRYVVPRQDALDDVAADPVEGRQITSSDGARRRSGGRCRGR